ncbi:hypothetical protein DH09_00450 (plasmid) [Bacillaceae bacterium JMAK1]|nr:hypothetical protein DH09_00450 [Bacillaceae bacterium JMAK1]
MTVEMDYTPLLPGSHRSNIEYSVNYVTYLMATEDDFRRLDQDMAVSKNDVEMASQFLSEHHPDVLTGAFGDREKKQELESLLLKFFMERNSGETSPRKIRAVVNRIVGLDVLEPLVNEENDIEDISVVAYNNIYLFRKGQGWVQSNVVFKTKEDAIQVAHRIAQAAGRSWNHTEPQCVAAFQNIRVQLSGHNMDIDTDVSITIRKHSQTLQITEESILSSGQASYELHEFLRYVIRSESRLLVAGTTGAGKTELFKYMVGLKAEAKKLILLEEDPEAYLTRHYPSHHISVWRTRDEFDYSRLLRSALTSRPDFICVQEVKSKEAYQLIKVAQTGHGSISTLHAMNAKQVPDRMVLMAQEGTDIRKEVLSEMVTDAFDFIIYVDLVEGKHRIITEVVEVSHYNLQTNTYEYRTIFSYDPKTRHHRFVERPSDEQMDRFRTRLNDDEYETLEGLLHPTEHEVIA